MGFISKGAESVYEFLAAYEFHSYFYVGYSIL
jgi:hypothetical protein